MAPREARARRCSSSANNRLAAMQLLAPFAGTVISVRPAAEAPVRAGTPIVVLEAMKMEHELVTERDAVVQRLEVEVGETVNEGQVLAELAELAEATAEEAVPSADGNAPDEATEREDLAQVRHRHELGLDAGRPEAVKRRHDKHRRTARENLQDLVDPGSFV